MHSSRFVTLLCALSLALFPVASIAQPQSAEQRARSLSQGGLAHYKDARYDEASRRDSGA